MNIDLTWEPEPEPEWTKAPAVLAKCPNCYEHIGETVHLEAIDHDWMCADCQAFFDFTDTKDVVPLYPLPSVEEIVEVIRQAGPDHPWSPPSNTEIADAVLELLKGQDR